VLVVVTVNRPAALREPESVQPARFSADQFLRMFDLGIFEDDHVELVHGEIIQLSPANMPHASMHARMIVRLAQLYGEKRVLADCLVRLDDDSVRAFDVTVLTAEAAPGDVLEPHQVLLGAEVAHSSVERDLGEKMRHYASAGIAQYLVADLNERHFHLMSDPEEGGFGRTERASFENGIDLPAGAGRLRLL
jgi:Uma2 family endonuclease